MNIKEASQIVDNPPPINWEWLAGFFQAEGYAGNMTADRFALQVTITQKERQILEHIADFLKEVQPNIALGIYGGTADHGAYFLRLQYRKSTKLMCEQILPYLRGDKAYRLRNAVTLSKVSVPTETAPWTYDFVTGFWEGDGGLSRSAFSCYVYFDQKDITVLEALQQFFGKGHYSRTGHTSTPRLGVTDDPNGLPLHHKLLEHARTHFRRVQLAGTLLGEGHAV